MRGDTNQSSLRLLSDPIDDCSVYKRETCYVVVKLTKAVLIKTLQENDDPLYPLYNSLKTDLTDNPMLCILHKQTSRKKALFIKDDRFAENLVVRYTVLRANEAKRSHIDKNSTVALEDLELLHAFFLPNSVGETSGLELALEIYNEMVQIESELEVSDDARLKRQRLTTDPSEDVDPSEDDEMEPPTLASPPLNLPQFRRSTSDSEVPLRITTASTCLLSPLHSPRPQRPVTVPLPKCFV